MQKSLSRRSVSIHPGFLLDPTFLQLRILVPTDDAARLIGRVVALALATLELRRREMHFAEIDAIVGWSGPKPFGLLLARVGWAKLREGAVEIDLPICSPPHNYKSVLAAKRNVASALRDKSGRFAVRDQKLEGAE